VCGQGEQRGSRTLVPVGPEIVAMASCDAQHIGNVHDARNVTSPANDDPSRTDANDDADANASTGDDARPGDAARGRDALVRAPMGTRARQTIPPALRRAILVRDQHRCRVPGCNNSRFLDLHHVLPRSEGGANHPANLLTLCGAHHRGVHRGHLIIERHAERRANSLRFLHADGRPYGEVGVPRPLDVNDLGIESKVASALRHLGFRDADVGMVLAQVRHDRGKENVDTEAGRSDMTAERLLREALVRLGRKRSART
jgi:hypothetical protein